jgi:hypothetical protein
MRVRRCAAVPDGRTSGHLRGECFPCSEFLIACKYMKWSKNQIAHGTGGGVFRATLFDCLEWSE